jgi:hypothetical protein
MSYKANPTKQDKPNNREENPLQPEPLPLPSDEDHPMPAPIREPDNNPPMGDPKPKEPPRLV